MKRALIVCVLAGCGTTEIDRDVCGNGIVEAGEDCDSTDPRCESCGVTCAATQDCLDYDPDGMTGFVCGPDGFCHAPTGTFQPVVAFAMPAESYRVTDVNGDGFGDLLVQSQTSVTAVFDATSAPTSASIQTPIPRGNAAYAYVDNDLSLDALLPTTDGIVAYTARFGVPSPYPFPSPIAPTTGAPIFVHPITTSPLDNHLGMVGTFPPSTKLVYVVLDAGQQPPVFMGQVDLCNGNLTDLDVSEIEVFETQPQHEILAVTLHPPGQPARTCVVTADFTGLAYDMDPIAFMPTAEPKSRPVLANLRGQVCPSLVIAQGAGQVVEYKPNAIGNPCKLESTTTAVLNAPSGAVPIGSVPLIPPISGRNFALALSSGIYDAVAGAQLNLTEVYRSDRVLTAVRSADLDGDGDTDVVAIGKDSEDLDILDRRVPGGFLRFRFDTAAPVAQFILGDFDGNELPDIAYVERDLDEQRLQIAYGTTDQFLSGVNVGTFAAVRSIVKTSIPDSTDPNRLIDDLAVLFDEPVVDLVGDVTFLPAISLLHGSPQRTMLAFFDPRTPPTASQSQFRGVVAGFFSGPASNGNDVVAIEQAGPTTRLYLSVGATNGGLQSQDANDTANVADCKGPAADPAGTALCIDDAHFLAWSVGDSHDLVLAVDSKLEVAAFDPRTLAGGAPVTMTRWTNMLVAPAGATVRKVQRVVLGESSPRLLVSMGPALGVTNPRLTGAVDLCVFDPVTGPVCEDLSERVSASGFGAQTCIDGGVARVASASRFSPPDSTSPDLVLLCRTDDGFNDALFRISFDGDVIRKVDLIDFVNADVLQIGDVSGDGIDDIVLLDRKTVIPIMTVYRQCNSRDTSCGFAAVVGEDGR